MVAKVEIEQSALVEARQAARREGKRIRGKWYMCILSVVDLVGTDLEQKQLVAEMQRKRSLALEMKGQMENVQAVSCTCHR